MSTHYTRPSLAGRTPVARGRRARHRRGTLVTGNSRGQLDRLRAPHTKDGCVL